MKANDRRLGAYQKILKKDPPSPRDEGDQDVARAHAPRSAERRAPGAAERRPSINLPGLIKVPSATGEGGTESPYRRVAKFLLIIGVDEAAKVMARLTPEQTEKVVLEIASIRRVDPEEATGVLAEFESLLRKAREPSGGLEPARTILEGAFGADRAEAMLNKAVPSGGVRPFDYLDGIDPERLRALVADELPAVKALVLSQLEPKLAAAVIARMQPDEKKDTVLRLAKLTSINPEVLRRVDEALREKTMNASATSSDSIDGRNALAEILKRMDGRSEQAILSGLADSDPDLGRDLRDRLFTIDDIVRADDRFVQETLRSMDDREVALVLAGKGAAFRAKLLANVSRGRAALIAEEERVSGPFPRHEADRASSSFFSVMRRAWEDGKYVIAGRDEGEQWVK